MENYTHMLQSKITGIVISRHTSERTALAALRKIDSSKNPLEMKPYSEIVFREMH